MTQLAVSYKRHRFPPQIIAQQQLFAPLIRLRLNKTQSDMDFFPKRIVFAADETYRSIGRSGSSIALSWDFESAPATAQKKARHMVTSPCETQAKYDAIRNDGS